MNVKYRNSKILLLFLTAFIAIINSAPVQDVEYIPDQDPNLFEGDIEGVEFLDNEKGFARIPTSTYGKWAGGVVPYIITANTYDDKQLKTIYDGMKWVEDQTRINGRDCIKFIPRTKEANYVRIHSGSGCSSKVGKVNAAGEQLVSLKRPTATDKGSCIYEGTVAHELIHALGFWHEQSRSDRDDYVKVNYENIKPESVHNFNKYETGGDTLGFPYDYYSVMHYSSTTFSSNGLPTIEPLEPGIELVHSSKRKSLSDIDIGEIRKYYGCS